MILRSVGAEFAKLKRSRAVLWTFLGVLSYTAMIVAVAPFITGKDGTKDMVAAGGIWKRAAEAGIYDDTWRAGLHQLPMSMASGLALLLFAFVAAYLFGHEFKEHTIVSALTTPVRREYVIVAKMLVLGVWLASLAVGMLLANILGIAILGGAPGFAWWLLLKALGEALAVTFMLYLTMPVFAWLAIWGRGYLRPMLAAIVFMGLGNSLATTDASPYYPWNMPLHAFGASWMPLPPSGLVVGSWVVAAAVFAAGTAGAMWQLDRADVGR